MRESILFSILIPTRNRLNLLKHAVNSVINQIYTNWELIVLDNCSDEDVYEWIKEIDDKRIKYKRQNQVVSVTDNWNDADEMANGEYTIMLGDDDALMPQALATLYDSLLKYEMPELIVYSAYVYLQPNVDPLQPQGKLFRQHPFEASRKTYGYLPLEYRKQMVANCCQFKERFGHNMQYYCYSKKVRESVKTYGLFYEPPYPDYYTSCMMLLVAEKAVLIPNRITIIGVTPKSYGFYYHNNREKEGMEFHKESNYRETAPLSIRDKLCSIDEMDTAAAATYAIIYEKYGGEEYKINIKNYYKAVIKRELMDNNWNVESISKLVSAEMRTYLSQEEYREIENYMKECLNNTKVHSVVQRNLPWKDVTELLSDIKLVEGAENLEDIDLIYWVNKFDVTNFSKGEEVYVWGAYYRGEIVKEVLNKKGIIVKGYIDNKNKQNKFGSLKIYTMKDIKNMKYPIVLSLKYLHNEVMEELTQRGYISEDTWVYRVR